MNHAKMFATFISIFLFVLGGALASIAILRGQFYPLPYRYFEEQGDGSYVKFAYYVPDKRPLIGDKDGSVVIEFVDWKNDAPVKRVIYPTNWTGSQDGIFFSDEKSVIALVADNVLYKYDKFARTVKKFVYDPQYRLVTLTPDQKHIVAYSGNSSTTYLLDWSGAIVADQQLTASSTPNSFVFSENGTVLTFITSGDMETPSMLYSWNLTTDVLTEEKRPAILKVLPYSQLMIDDAGKPYLYYLKGTDSKRVPL
jgi:hypothetical protein